MNSRVSLYLNTAIDIELQDTEPSKDWFGGNWSKFMVCVFKKYTNSSDVLPYNILYFANNDNKSRLRSSFMLIVIKV